MPPLYDNIADALPLICDDYEHTITLNASGATHENNEQTSTQAGWSAGVWLKLDLSAPGHLNKNTTWPAGPSDNEGRSLNQVHGTVALTRLSGTWIPYLDCVYGLGGFDVNNPDFDLTDRGDFSFGDGNTSFTLTQSARPDTGHPGIGEFVFYLPVIDWNWAVDADGSVEITYRFTAPDLIAADLINGNSTTVFSVSGWVRDEQILYSSAAQDGDGWNWAAEPSRMTDTIIATGSDLPGIGVYDAFAAQRLRSGDTGPTGNPIAVCRNGLVLRNWNELITNSTSPGASEIANRVDDGRWGNASGVPIRAISDVISFRWGLWSTPGLTHRAEVYRIALRSQDPVADPRDPPGGEPTIFNATELPLGWTGPEPITFADIEAGTLGRGGEIETISLCELNGELFLFWVETDGFGLALHLLGPAIKKWDGSSWTLLTDDLWGHGADIAMNSSVTSRMHGSIASCTDGTFIYFAWAESDGTATGSRRNWHWRCKRYDPGTGTFTELGTGPNAGEGNRRFDPAGTIAAQVGSPTPYSGQTGNNEGYGTWGHAMMMKAKAGKVWLAMVEPDTSRSTITKNLGRPCMWYWDGAAWNENHPPDPSLVTGASDYYADGAGTTERVPQVGFDFIHAAGVSDWPSIIYQVNFYDGGGATMDEITHVYCERDAGGWGTNLEIASIDQITGFDSNLWTFPTPPVYRFTRNGYIMFPLNGRPAWFANYNSFVIDPAVVVSIDADGLGMTFEGYPSEIIATEGFGSMADVVMYGTVPVIACPDNSDFGNFAYSLVVMEEMGTGDGFHGAKDFADRMFAGYSRPALATDGTTVWMAATDNFDLQVWAYNPAIIGVPQFGDIKFP